MPHVAAVAQQVGALLGKELVEVQVAAGLLAVDDGRLARELGCGPEPGGDMGKAG